MWVSSEDLNPTRQTIKSPPAFVTPLLGPNVLVGFGTKWSKLLEQDKSNRYCYLFLEICCFWWVWRFWALDCYHPYPWSGSGKTDQISFCCPHWWCLPRSTPRQRGRDLAARERSVDLSGLHVILFPPHLFSWFHLKARKRNLRRSCMYLLIYRSQRCKLGGLSCEGSGEGTESGWVAITCQIVYPHIFFLSF